MSAFAEEGGIWGTLDSLVSKYGTPLADQFIYGQSAPDKHESQEERIRYGQLNGSGPNDANQARKAPTNIWEFLFGRQTGEAVSPTATTAAAAAPTVSWGLVLVVGLVVFFLWRK